MKKQIARDAWMAEPFTKFRSSLNGFHRGDVVAYVEQSARQAAAQTKALQEQLDEANRRAAALEDEIETLRQQAAALEEEKAALQQALAAAMEAPQAAPEAQAPAPEDWGAEELAAYRRAEAVERLAMERAAALSRQTTSILAAANARFQCAGSDVAARCAELAALLEQLQGALGEIDATYHDAAVQLAAMEPAGENTGENS